MLKKKYLIIRSTEEEHPPSQFRSSVSKEQACSDENLGKVGNSGEFREEMSKDLKWNSFPKQMGTELKGDHSS
jgi:hypothetical protein